MKTKSQISYIISAESSKKEIISIVSNWFFFDYFLRFSDSRLNARATRETHCFLDFKLSHRTWYAIRYTSRVIGIGYFGRGCAIQTSIAATSTQCITKKGRCARGTLSANHLWPRLETPLCWRGWGTPRE